MPANTKGKRQCTDRRDHRIFRTYGQAGCRRLGR